MKTKVTLPLAGVKKARSGVALIIVLCFVVLLTGLVLTLISRSLSNGLISRASANVSKTDLYGHGAIDQVIGDLRQEIVDGSPTTISVSGNTIYRSSSPNTSSQTTALSYVTAMPYNAGPASYGDPTNPTATSIWNNPNGGLLNLVKESTRNVPFYSKSSTYPYAANGPSRAAPINSSTDVSLNGRYVSPARWNKALLLPKKNANIQQGSSGTTISDSSSPDTTPTTSFVAPDWILSTVDPTVSVPTAYSADMSNPQKPSYVVGRYAYTIYNEGGLLDANVASSPSSLSPAAGPNGGPSQQTLWSKKGPASFADLTVLPGISNVTSVSPQQVVDALVGWRNSATAQSTTSGALSAYTFTSTGIDSYFASILGRFTKFMTVGSSTTASDNAFTSRQQLISFLQNVANGSTQDQAYLQDAMMYLGTFSRTLNQPSYWPSPNRPVETGGTWSASIWTANPNGNPPLSPQNYSGFNNAVGQEPSYNPPFRSIRVSGGFTRNDGTQAVAGEPLVKKRFPLNRLVWITPYGPIANSGGGFSPPASYISYLETTCDLSAAFLQQGTPTNIQKYFGLTWVTDATQGFQGYWTYAEPGVPSGNVGALTDAQTANREPDFFELLQAAVKVGAIANPAAFSTVGGSEATGANAEIKDTQLIYQIMQMGANIIDETNPTQYPTHIQFTALSPTGSGPQDIYGVTDLPYLYAHRNIAFPTQLSNPSPPPGPKVSGPTAPSPAGLDVAMVVPVIWNPYDVNGPSALSGFAPTQLAITAAYGNLTTNPPQPSPNGRWTLEPVCSVEGTASPVTPTMPQYYTTPGGWTEANTELDFINPTPGSGSSLYREPTALLVAGRPDGSGLAPAPGGLNIYQEGAVPANKIVGFPIATFPQRWSDGTFIYTANTFRLSGSYILQPTNGFTIRLKYKNASNNWVTYYQNYLNGEQNVTASFSTTTGKTIFTSPVSGTSYWDTGAVPGTGDYVKWSCHIVYDPRTARWGTPEGIYTDPNERLPVLSFLSTTEGDPNDLSVETVRPSATAGNDISSDASGDQNQYQPQDSGWVYATSGSPYMRSGAVEQNIFGASQMYYGDADQVVRRAMGAYVPIRNTSTSASSMGLPLAAAPKTPEQLPPINGNPTAVLTSSYTPSSTQSQSRPIMLHRPFRSVAELGYVFSDTPWRNIDFFTPESGFSAFLDTFCVDDDTRPDALAAGRVDLNTKQAPVIQALLAGAYRDEEASPPASALIASEAANISQMLVKRTTVGGTNPNPNVQTTGPQPLSNIADLVGRWWKQQGGVPINGSAAYDGFSADLMPYVTATGIVMTPGAYAQNPPANNLIQRFGETALRALSDAGQAGTWNLMIDLVAQSGRYPTTAVNSSNPLAAFLVEGERHYWVHLAIDRQTGQVIDENIEVVNE
jgi:hypothetical protein